MKAQTPDRNEQNALDSESDYALPENIKRREPKHRTQGTLRSDALYRRLEREKERAILRGEIIDESW